MGRVNLRGGRRRSKLTGAHDLIHLMAIERLVFEQRFGDQLKLVTMYGEQIFGDRIGLINDAFDFRVNFLKTNSSSFPYWTMPSRVLIPHWVTMARAIFVAC